MKNSVNASDITHMLAILGGGSVKEGGGGMKQGLVVVAKTCIKIGYQLCLDGKDLSQYLDGVSSHLLKIN